MAMMEGGPRKRGQDGVHEARTASEVDREYEVGRTDHFGFQIKDEREEFHYLPRMPTDLVKERERKWLKMIAKWDYYMEKKPRKIKERCRKGIPSSLRHQAWLRLSGAHRAKEQQPLRFENLQRFPDNSYISDIEKDLSRTFPHHELFAGKGSQGQQDLRKVLKAFAHHNDDIGYCQAMSPVAATLLLNMPAEDAFWCLVQICEHYLPKYYDLGLRGVQVDARVLDSLVAKYLPDISRHLKEQKVDALLFCVEWFMSVFCRTLPWSCVLRLWDIFFFEGVKALFRTSLAVLRLTLGSKKQRQQYEGFFDINQKFRNLTVRETHEEILIPVMFAFNVSSRELEKEYVKQEQALRAEEEKTETKRRMRKRELEEKSERGTANHGPDHSSHELSTNHVPHDQLPTMANHLPDMQLPTNHTSSRPPTGHTPQLSSNTTPPSC